MKWIINITLIVFCSALLFNCNSKEPASKAPVVNKNPNNQKVKNFSTNAEQKRKIGPQLAAEKVIGTWQLNDKKTGGVRTVNYKADNTFTANVNFKNEEFNESGVWRVSGDQLKIKRQGANIEVDIPVEVKNNQLIEKYYSSGNEEQKVYSKIEAR